MARLADLAQANLLAMDARRAEVGIHIRHLRDQPGALLDFLRSQEDVPGRGVLLQTLTTAAYGGGLLMSTRTGVGLAGGAGHVQPVDLPDLEVTATDRTSRYFTGRAAPSPTFLYQGKSVLEGLVVVARGGARPTQWHGKQLRELAAIIASAAADRLSAPLISLQAPAQVPWKSFSRSRTTNTEDEWTRSYAIALRFAIAAGDLTYQQRQDALSDLLTHCERRSFGLALIDPRPSHRSGNWFWLLNPDPPRQEVFDGDGADGEEMCAAYPLTLVGPARVGTTSAVLDCLNELDNLGIVALSVTSLSDLAFISIWLGLSKRAWTERKSNEAWRMLPESSERRVLQVLPEVLNGVGFSRSISSASLARLQMRAGDYAACHGPTIRLNLNASRTSRPIWFSINSRNPIGGLGEGLSSLFRSFGELLAPAVPVVGEQLADGRPVRQPNIDYLIARSTEASGFRAKGKLSVPDVALQALLPDIPNGERATLLARTLEGQWAQDLVQESGYNVSVAWRENWLGHWSARSRATGSSA